VGGDPYGFQDLAITSGIRGNLIWTGPFSLEDRDLLSEGEEFKGGIAATAEEHPVCSQNREDEFERELIPVTWRNVSLEDPCLGTSSY
jgi:hypothetical protein